MPLCYSHFKSFSNKIWRIFLFEQLLFTKVVKLTYQGQDGLGLSGEGRQGANVGWVIISDVKGSPHTTCTRPNRIMLTLSHSPDCVIHQGSISLVSQTMSQFFWQYQKLLIMTVSKTLWHICDTIRLDNWSWQHYVSGQVKLELCVK